MFTIFLASTLAGVLIGLTESINKRITEKKYSVFAYAFLQSFFSAILFFCLFLYKLDFPRSPLGYLYIIISAILIIIGNSLLIKAYKTEDFSVVSIISRLSLVVTFVIGIVILAESASIIKYLGVTCIIAGVILIFYKRSLNKISSGTIFVILSALAFGLVALFIKKTYEYISLYTGVFLLQTFLAVFLFMLSQTRRDAYQIFRKYKKKILLARIFAVGGIYLTAWSLKNGAISIVNTNFETFFLLSSLLIGIFVFKEKTSLLKKVIGGGLCMIGIILLNFF